MAVIQKVKHALGSFRQHRQQSVPIRSDTSAAAKYKLNSTVLKNWQIAPEHGFAQMANHAGKRKKHLNSRGKSTSSAPE